MDNPSDWVGRVVAAVEQAVADRFCRATATYRLQFDKEALAFRAAAAIVPYLDALGVSHVYASPCFKTRSGSANGYAVNSWQNFRRVSAKGRNRCSPWRGNLPRILVTRGSNCSSPGARCNCGVRYPICSSVATTFPWRPPAPGRDTFAPSRGNYTARGKKRLMFVVPALAGIRAKDRLKAGLRTVRLWPRAVSRRNRAHSAGCRCGGPAADCPVNAHRGRFAALAAPAGLAGLAGHAAGPKGDRCGAAREPVHRPGLPVPRRRAAGRRPTL